MSQGWLKILPRNWTCMSAGVGIFVHIINYAIRNGNTVLENYLKTCSKSETSLSKYPR